MNLSRLLFPRLFATAALCAAALTAAAQSTTPRPVVEEYTDTTLVGIPARKAQGGIIVTGRGASLRAFSAFSSTQESNLAYAAIANKYAATFGSGVTVYCMPIPLAAAYYTPPSASTWTRSQAAAINRIFAALAPEVVAVDIYTTLGRHAAEPIYSRTDHHWQPLGGFYAAARFAEAAGVPFRSLADYDTLTVHRFVGTMPMFAKDPSIRRAPEDFVYYVPRGVDYTTTYINYTLDSRRRNVVGASTPTEGTFFKTYKDGSGAAYCTFMGGDSKLVHVHTSTANGRRLLILKDSFGNALPGFLFYSFEDIHVVDCRYFTQNLVRYVKDNGITDILFANNLSHASTAATVRAYERYLVQ
ncbi:MAG: hypothetical protein J6M53_03430 [Bacteroidaceae bacterium]|nr:hypothetical protein [Bacteroidaceae bacterium]